MTQEPEEPVSTEEDDAEDDDPPWKTLGLGLLVLGFAGYLFYDFSQLEAEGGSRKVWWVLALIYNVGGKWPPVLLLGLAGFAVSALGVRGLIARK